MYITQESWTYLFRKTPSSTQTHQISRPTNQHPPFTTPNSRKMPSTHFGDLDPLAGVPLPSARPLPDPPAGVGGEEGSSFAGEFLLTLVKWPWRAVPERGVCNPGEEAADEERGIFALVPDDDESAVPPLLSSSPPMPFAEEPMLMRLTVLSPPALVRRRRRLGVARLQLPGALAPV